MEIALFDKASELPTNRGEHVFIFTGVSAEHGGHVVTYVDYCYNVGENQILYRLNSNIVTVRFEDAVSWAVEKARKIGVDKIYALFTLGRRIDMHVLRSTYAVRVTDNREPDQNASQDVERGNRPASWISIKPAFNSKLKRQRLFA